MKRAVLIFITLVSFGAVAQISTPQDATIKYDGKERPCIMVNVDPEPKTLKKAWKEYLKDKYDFKLKGIGFLSNKDVLKAEEITIPAYSDKALNFYTEIIEDKNGSQMKVFISYGYDMYVTSNEFPKEYVLMRNDLSDFVKSYLSSYYQEIIDDTSKALKSLEKDQSKLEKNISKDSEKSKEMKEEIEELEKEISENKKELEEVKEKVSSRKIKLERVKERKKLI